MVGLRTSNGPGRPLVVVYAVFAISSCARAGSQLVTSFDEAPLAYSLSALAAVVYVVATLALARDRPRLALVAVAVEMVGVVVVGTASLLAPDAFPQATVWSQYGLGYAFVPLVLPVLGLLWLRRQRAGRLTA